MAVIKVRDMAGGLDDRSHGSCGHGIDHAASTIVAAISLFTRCTVPLPHPTIFATLRMP